MDERKVWLDDRTRWEKKISKNHLSAISIDPCCLGRDTWSKSAQEGALLQHIDFCDHFSFSQQVYVNSSVSRVPFGFW